MAKQAFRTPGSLKMSMPEANSKPPLSSMEGSSTMPTWKLENEADFKGKRLIFAGYGYLANKAGTEGEGESRGGEKGGREEDGRQAALGDSCHQLNWLVGCRLRA